MKPWTNLNPLPAYPWLSKPLKARRSQLNARMDELIAARAACDADLRALAVAPLESIKPAQVAPLEAKAARASDRFGLLQLELHLRRDLAEYLAEQTATRRKACDEATNGREALMATVRQGLVALGYVDSELPCRGWITPDMIMRHPRVADARELIDELSEDDGAARLNRDALSSISDELEGIRRAAVGPH